MMSQRKRASVVEEQDISHGFLAVQPKVGSVLAARCMAILQFAAETSTERHLRKGRGLRPKNTSGNRQAFRRQTNQVEDYVSGSSQEEENPAFAFTVMEGNEGVCKVSTARHVPTMNVSIDGIVQEVLIYSGSMSNLMGEDDFQKLKNAGFKGNLEHRSRKLFAYCGREIEVVGQFKADTSVGNAKVVSNFVVVKCGRCILGNTTAKELGVLHIGLKASPIGGSCNEVKSDFANQLKAQYPRVVTGVGKLKDFELKLHVDPNVPPVAQKLRRVPFALRAKVKAKIDELLEGDIIERVEGRTTWASPVVVAPKPSGEIRFCVDMRRANEAIIRERLPIPTVDEVLEELNGSTVFSKLDLRHDFHQVELHADSRDITTFVTHDGLFRYKRLSFGVNAAPEKYQHITT